MGAEVTERIRDAVAGLSPGYFAIVMASGSISIGMRIEDRPLLSRALLGVCVIAFVALLVLSAIRLRRFGERVVADLTDSGRAFGFFTTVAGANVLATALLAFDADLVSVILLLAATVLCLVLGYVIPWSALLRRSTRTGLVGADGSWFIWAVACQSIAVAAASLAPAAGDRRQLLAFGAVIAWSVGCFLYAAVAVLVTLRNLLLGSTAEQLNPSYWVAMGAASITVLAGARIVPITDVAVVNVTGDLIAALSVMFWAFATWLIPLLVCAMCWRHLLRRVPVAYDATWWSLVFPLGMYAIASMYLGDADGLEWVSVVGRVELWLAFAAWVVALTAMGVHLYRRLFAPPSPA